MKKKYLHMKTKIDKVILDNMSKDATNWKGIFYFNRKDPRIIVPKIIPSMGWTLNFSNPYSYIALIAIIGVIILTQFLIKM